MSALNIILIIAIILMMFLLLFFIQKINHLKEIFSVKEKSFKDIESEFIILKEKLEKSKNINVETQNEFYKKGYSDCEKNNKFEVRINEFENKSGKNWWVYSTEKYEFGFEYTLFINNLPLKFEPVKQPIKTLNKSEINEKNVKELIKIFSDIENLKSNTFKVSKSISKVKDKISKLLLNNGK